VLVASNNMPTFSFPRSEALLHNVDFVLTINKEVSDNSACIQSRDHVRVVHGTKRNFLWLEKGSTRTVPLLQNKLKQDRTVVD
jgi:hypothetical protein